MEGITCYLHASFSDVLLNVCISTESSILSMVAGNKQNFYFSFNRELDLENTITTVLYRI